MVLASGGTTGRKFPASLSICANGPDIFAAAVGSHHRDLYILFAWHG